MRPDDHRHGTEAGNEQHWRDGEDPCPPCHQAKILAARRRGKRKSMGHLYQRPLGDVWHMLNDLASRGVLSGEIERVTGLVESQVWRALKGGPETIVYERTWQKLANIDVNQLVTPIGITRRIRALRWVGYSTAAIAAEAGCHVDSVRDAQVQPRDFVAMKVRDGIVAAYDRLAFQSPEATSQQHLAGISRSRNLARRNGWASPMAWDHIDLDERPADDLRDRRPDQVVIDRILAGDMTLAKTATKAEKVAVVTRWRADGRSLNELDRLSGWQSRRYLEGEAA